MPPRGKPTTSTDRMRAARLRAKGEAPALKKCSVCGKILKPGAGSGKAYAAGLCWAHWKVTPEGRKERQRQNLTQDVWRVGYFGCQPGEEPEFQSTMRKALKASFVDRTLTRNNPIWVVWSDGSVTIHHGLSAGTALGVTPDDGDHVIDDAEWFRDHTPDSKRTWFEV